MKCIKEFLKPNKWKVGIFVIFGLSGFFCLMSPASPPENGGITGNWGMCYAVLFPAILLNTKIQTLILIGIILIQWYLLVCLIYFIIIKIKRLIGK